MSDVDLQLTSGDGGGRVCVRNVGGEFLTHTRGGRKFVRELQNAGIRIRVANPTQVLELIKREQNRLELVEDKTIIKDMQPGGVLDDLTKLQFCGVT